MINKKRYIHLCITFIDLSTSYMYIMSCDSHSSHVSSAVFITPILLRGKLRHGEVKQLSECHRASM